MSLTMQTVPYKNPMRICNTKDTLDGRLVRTAGNRAVLIMPMSGTQHLVNHPVFMHDLAIEALRKGWRKIVLRRYCGFFVFVNINQYCMLYEDEKAIKPSALSKAPTHALNFPAHWRQTGAGTYQY